jgi:hypothetical protein
MRFGNTSVVVNEQSRDCDFRVESNSNSNMFFVNAGADTVHIGSTSGSSVLNLYATGRGGGVIGLNVVNQDSGNDVNTLFNTTNNIDQDFQIRVSEVGASTKATYIGPSTNTNLVITGASVGTLNKDLALSSTSIVVNQDSRNMDFRVESDTNANALFVDAGNSRVGINNSGPSFQLQVGATNTANMGVGWQRTETFAVDIHSSDRRWYKLANYTTNILQGQLYMTSARGGGANQTNGGRIQHGTLSGYNNTVQNNWGDLGTNYGYNGYYVEVGTDNNVYLRVNASIYGGSIFCVFQGRGNWVFDGTYVTSAP